MRWRLESSGSPLFTNPFIPAQTIENTKAPRHWPLWREKTSNAETVWWRHHEVYRMPHTLHPTKHVLFLRFVVCYVSVDYWPFLLISFSIISLKLGEQSNHEGEDNYIAWINREVCFNLNEIRNHYHGHVDSVSCLLLFHVSSSISWYTQCINVI